MVVVVCIAVLLSNLYCTLLSGILNTLPCTYSGDGGREKLVTGIEIEVVVGFDR